MPHSRPSRLQVVSICFIAAMLLAAAIALSPLVRAVQQGTAADTATDERPALRVAQRAGLVTVGLEVRDDGYRIALHPPDIDIAAPTVTRVGVSRNAGPATILSLASCGEACLIADDEVPSGAVTLDVDIDFAGRHETARFRFPWPMPPRAESLLKRAIRYTAARDEVWVRERVTSDPQWGIYANPPKLVTGDDVANSYAAAGAKDLRELPGRKGLRRIAYYLPTISVWVEVWIAPDGQIVRDRFTSHTRLWTQTYTYPGP